MRFALDTTWSRASAHTLLAGSPLRLFRVTDGGARVLDALAAGDEVTPSLLTDRLTDAGAIHPLPPPSRHFTHADVTVVTPQLGGVVTRDGRITVDDGSAPPLIDATLRLDANVGPGGARNHGRTAVTTPFVLFLDADVEVRGMQPLGDNNDPLFWEPLLAHFDDARVGLVAPRVAGDAGSSLDLGPEPARISAGTRVSYVPGAALLVRTNAFDDIGGFDPSLRVGEDVDFVWRMDEAGWQCRYEPAAVVEHRPRDSFRAQLQQQTKYGSSSAPLAARHPQSLTPFRSGPWIAGAWAALGLGHPAVAAAVAVANVADLKRKLPAVSWQLAGGLVGRTHLAATGDFGRAVRRAWFPLVLLGSIVSRRARLVAAASLLAHPATVVRDTAFGVGLWRSMLALREPRPIIPKVSGWQMSPVTKRATP